MIRAVRLAAILHVGNGAADKRSKYERRDEFLRRAALVQSFEPVGCSALPLFRGLDYHVDGGAAALQKQPRGLLFGLGLLGLRHEVLHVADLVGSDFKNHVARLQARFRRRTIGLHATYYDALAKFAKLGVKHETAVRSAFQELLEHCARQFDWKLVPEYAIKRKGKPDAKADGALLDNYGLNHGLWEAKDSADDVNREIKHKFSVG